MQQTEGSHRKFDLNPFTNREVLTDYNNTSILQSGAARTIVVEARCQWNGCPRYPRHVRYTSNHQMYVVRYACKVHDDDGIVLHACTGHGPV